MTPPKKRKWKWDDKFPLHLRHFCDSLRELDDLKHIHLEILTNETAEQEGDWVQDKHSVFTDSTLILLIAAWEFFIEELALATTHKLIEVLDKPENLPKSLKKVTLQMLKNDKNELALWSLADDGWKQQVLDAVDERVKQLNTPRSTLIDQLYTDLFGISPSKSWTWDYISEEAGTVQFDSENTIDFIDGTVSLRGSIAHGESSKKVALLYYLQNVVMRMMKITSIMSNDMSNYVKEIAGIAPWETVRFDPDWRPLLREDCPNEKKE